MKHDLSLFKSIKNLIVNIQLIIWINLKKLNYKLLIYCAALFSIIACNTKSKTFDASGTFEAEETIISAGANGVIRQFDIEEGRLLTDHQQIGYIDSMQLYLKKKQLTTQINALLSRQPNVSVQLAGLQQQLATAEKDKTRIINLIKSDAAPAKQLDDINSTIEVIKKQIEALKSSLEITSQGISNDTLPLFVQIEQINDQLEKTKIINPMNGTVLLKFAQVNEMTAIGKPLYKIADLKKITLRAYITSDQLPVIKLNQNVKVNTDDGKGGFYQDNGIVTWISDKAEFTPKTVQTKDERANMVYAVKVNVKNDGRYKIGMYGEIKFQ